MQRHLASGQQEEGTQTCRAKWLRQIFPIHGEFSKISCLCSSRARPGAADPRDSLMSMRERMALGLGGTETSRAFWGAG